MFGVFKGNELIRKTYSKKSVKDGETIRVWNNIRRSWVKLENFDRRFKNNHNKQKPRKNVQMQLFPLFITNKE